MWSPRRAASQEQMWRTSNIPKERLGFPGEKMETLAFRKDNVTTRPSVRTEAPPMEIVVVGLEARPSQALRESPRSRSRSQTLIAPIANPSTMKRGLTPHWSFPPKDTMSDLSRDPPIDIGGTNSDMRAQAVPPTRTAPTIAKASRQPSDGMPIWANPSVAW